MSVAAIFSPLPRIILVFSNVSVIRDVTEGAGPAAPCRGQTTFLLQIYIHSSVCYTNNIKRTRFSDRHFYTETASDPSMKFHINFACDTTSAMTSLPGSAGLHENMQ